MKNKHPNDDDPWSGIISDTAFAVPITHHTKLQATPGQLFFVRDMIINNPFITDWEAIRRHKQQLTEKTQSENKNRKPHIYRVCEKVLVCNKKSNKYEYPYKVSYPITNVRKNGTVTICRGAVKERIHIRWIKPYNI